jgi:hypothetical protein
LSIDVTPSSAVRFRDGVIKVVEKAVGHAHMPRYAKEGLVKVFNYAGGAFIYTKKAYRERIRLVTESWEIANAFEAGAEAEDSNQRTMDKTNKSGIDGSGDGSGEGSGENLGKSKDKDKSMPQTFDDMFTMNAAVMGLADIAWMKEITEVFTIMVRNFQNSVRIQEICDTLSLGLKEYEAEEVNLAEFKSCMMAALRSMLPKHWTPDHEVAWTWLWESISHLLTKEFGRPQERQAILSEFFEQLDEEMAFEIRKHIYAKLFEVAPAAQEFFKQSNTRLHFVADLVFKLTVDIFAEPERMVKEISALGLRHVGFGIPIDLFGPFVTSCVDVLDGFMEDRVLLDSYRWSLGLISKILTRTCQEGSTVVMKAINANSVKQLKMALSSAPRGDRFSWMLLVQVGAQSISPLAWSIESGKLDMARVILEDLLTIRSDRATYYYGADDLFTRHPDIVKKLCAESPMLLVVLLDKLVWRSHRPKNNLRRVNYYMEHMLITGPKSEFSDGLQCICALGEPSTMAHPLVIAVSDSLWAGIVYRQFLTTKAWNLISLAVFILAQSTLPRLEVAADRQATVNIIILTGKTFNYIIGMGRLGMAYLLNFYVWSRKELKRIFDEIDQDGSGDIDWDEFMDAMTMFKELIRDNVVEALGLNKAEKVIIQDDNAKGVEKKTNTINLLLFTTLILMVTHEPMYVCSEDPNFPTNSCPDADTYQWRYSMFTMCCMIVHWMAIIDLSALSTNLSAFLLVIKHILAEVRQFIIALTFLLLMFGSAICILCRDCTIEGGDFGDMPQAVTSLLAITVRLYQGDFRDMAENVLLLIMVLICTTLTAVLLLNLLVAQLNLSYEFVDRDVEGFARLNRASLICQSMDLCSRVRWSKFKKSMCFDVKLEFDEGDIGLAGGVQILELAGLHRTTEEAIIRYGGTTDKHVPWPSSKDEHHGGEDRFERLAELLEKVTKQVVMNAREHGRGGGRSSVMDTGETRSRSNSK